MAALSIILGFFLVFSCTSATHDAGVNFCESRDGIMGLNIPPKNIQKIIFTFFSPFQDDTGDFDVSFSDLIQQSILVLSQGNPKGVSPREFQDLFGISGNLALLFLDHDENGFLSVDEIRDIWEVGFNIIDTNNNGKISRSEVEGIDAELLKMIIETLLTPLCDTDAMMKEIVTNNPQLLAVFKGPMGELLEILFLFFFEPNEKGEIHMPFERLMERLKQLAGPKGFPVRLVEIFGFPKDIVDGSLNADKDAFVTAQELRPLFVLLYGVIDTDRDLILTNSEIDSLDLSSLVTAFIKFFILGI